MPLANAPVPSISTTLANSVHIESSCSGITHTTCVGTPRYMAPEVLSAEAASRKYDQRCDVYSFGMLLWEVMHRKTAFADFNGMHVAVILAPSTQRPPLSLDVGFEEVSRLITLCWHHDPTQRPSMEACVEVLAEFQEQTFHHVLDDSRLSNSASIMSAALGYDDNDTAKLGPQAVPDCSYRGTSAPATGSAACSTPLPGQSARTFLGWSGDSASDGLLYR